MAGDTDREDTEPLYSCIKLNPLFFRNQALEDPVHRVHLLRLGVSPRLVPLPRLLALLLHLPARRERIHLWCQRHRVRVVFALGLFFVGSRRFASLVSCSSFMSRLQLLINDDDLFLVKELVQVVQFSLELALSGAAVHDSLRIQVVHL